MAKGKRIKSLAEVVEEVQSPESALADMHFNDGDYEEAAAAYQKILEEECTAHIHEKLANCYLKLGRHEEAEAEYKKAVELKPESSYFHACLADFYAEIGNVDEARAIFQKAAELCENKDEYIRERLAELGS